MRLLVTRISVPRSFINSRMGHRTYASSDVNLFNLSRNPARPISDDSDLYLEFLGTSSSVSTLTRNVSSLLVRWGGGAFMVDCGEGTIRQMLRSSCNPSDLDAVFVTHLHCDHIYGLPGLGIALSPLKDTNNQSKKTLSRFGSISMDQDDGLMPLFAPEGLSGALTNGALGIRNMRYMPIPRTFPRRPIARDCKKLNPSFPRINLANSFPLTPNNDCHTSVRIKVGEHREEHDSQAKYQNNGLLEEYSGDFTISKPSKGMTSTQSNTIIYENGKFTVKAIPIRHTIFCLGFIFEERPMRGSFRVQHLDQIGVPRGPMYSCLERGDSITTPAGRVVSPAEAFEPPRPGRKIVVLGDTFDPSEAIPLAMDADVLVHEATCSDEESSLALKSGHSTAGMAGLFARRIRAKNLVLNHFSPRNIRSSEYDECVHVRNVVSQARRAFGCPNVYAASDFYRFPIQRPI